MLGKNREETGVRLGPRDQTGAGSKFFISTTWLKRTQGSVIYRM
jgi:hypothetical protein